MQSKTRRHENKFTFFAVACWMIYLRVFVSSVAQIHCFTRLLILRKLETCGQKIIFRCRFIHFDILKSIVSDTSLRQYMKNAMLNTKTWNIHHSTYDVKHTSKTYIMDVRAVSTAYCAHLLTWDAIIRRKGKKYPMSSLHQKCIAIPSEARYGAHNGMNTQEMNLNFPKRYTDPC